MILFSSVKHTHKDILRNNNTFDNNYFESTLGIVLTISNFASTCQLAVIEVLVAQYLLTLCFDAQLTDSYKKRYKQMSSTNPNLIVF